MLTWYGLGVLGFGSSLGLFQIFSLAHYSKKKIIEKIIIVIETRDFGYWYKMGCLQLPLFWQSHLL